MRVAINCLNLNTDYVGGVNSFTLGLLSGFARTAPEHQFRLFVTSDNQTLFDCFRKEANFELVVLDNRKYGFRKNLARGALLGGSLKRYANVSNLIFRSYRALVDEHADLVYVPSAVLQFFDHRRPTLLSMHDIQHVHYPEFFSWPMRLSRRTTYGLSAQRADFIQASSEFIKRDLLQHFQFLEARQIEVVPEGVDIDRFCVAAVDDTLRQYHIPQKFIFFPAQLWFHKNHITLLRALKQIEVNEGVRIPLVLTGGRYSAERMVFRYIDEEKLQNVHYLGKVPFADLVQLYKNSILLVTPSLHESSSLPILEAAAAGLPIVASRIPPHEEIGRTLQLNFFDPLNVDQLAQTIHRLFDDAEARAKQAQYNRGRIGKYSWENSARQYVNLFSRMLEAKSLSF